MARGNIELRGVSVNNLRNIDLDLPRGKLIAICGVSGSGKTSLVFDTLYAEGQRRYVETFSPNARKFLEQLDKPAAERIDGIPPTVAVTRRQAGRSSRVTVGAATELDDLIAAVLARFGQIECLQCGRRIRRDSPQDAAEYVSRLPPGKRIMIGFESHAEGKPAAEWIASLIDAGYVRVIHNGRTSSLSPGLADDLPSGGRLTVVLDRLKSGDASSSRLDDSLEAAFAAAAGNVLVFIDEKDALCDSEDPVSLQSTILIDEQAWLVKGFNSELHCRDCDLIYLQPEPQLFNYNRPLGACPACQGLGRPSEAASPDASPCPACGGARLRPEALAIQVAGYNFDDFGRMTVDRLSQALSELPTSVLQSSAGGQLLEEIRRKLGYLRDVGLHYVALNRPLRTLSAGEAQRVALTSSLASNLIGMLYVLDEPSVGLHPRDVGPLAEAIKRLQLRGNTVIAVEHEPQVLRQADEIVELGPGAGGEGGNVIFQGPPAALMDSSASRTGPWLTGRNRTGSGQRRSANHGWIKLLNARGRNLQNLTVEFPLGVLCLVAGVSGAGKSTLVDDTLYPALLTRLDRENNSQSFSSPLPYDNLLGAGQLEFVQLVDQNPIGRSPRSNPATFLKILDPVRALFAEQPEAKARGFSAGHFSYNVDGGRCEACRGDGYISVDMHFMADVLVRCRECAGKRYRREVLEVKYRGRSIADVLEMPAREAFAWFRGEHAVQSRIKPLLDVGLDYLRLGQPANTLSGGEAQRLKLARQLIAKRTGPTLFILDEPTTGLHFSDILRLIDCFHALLDVGHSLIVVEHNLQLMTAADYIIDLGPGAADNGGQVVACGTPEQVAACGISATAPFLARELAASVGGDN